MCRTIKFTNKENGIKFKPLNKYKIKRAKRSRRYELKKNIISSGMNNQRSNIDDISDIVLTNPYFKNYYSLTKYKSNKHVDNKHKKKIKETCKKNDLYNSYMPDITKDNKSVKLPIYNVKQNENKHSDYYLNIKKYNSRNFKYFYNKRTINTLIDNHTDDVNYDIDKNNPINTNYDGEYDDNSDDEEIEYNNNEDNNNKDDNVDNSDNENEYDNNNSNDEDDNSDYYNEASESYDLENDYDKYNNYCYGYDSIYFDDDGYYVNIVFTDFFDDQYYDEDEYEEEREYEQECDTDDYNDIYGRCFYYDEEGNYKSMYLTPFSFEYKKL